MAQAIREINNTFTENNHFDSIFLERIIPFTAINLVAPFQLEFLERIYAVHHCITENNTQLQRLCQHLSTPKNRKTTDYSAILRSFYFTLSVD